MLNIAYHVAQVGFYLHQHNHPVLAGISDAIEVALLKIHNGLR